MDFKATSRLKRLLAYLIDLLIFIPIIALQFFLVNLGYYYQILAELLVISFGIWYFVVYVYQHEYTFGKRYENIRIISVDGSRISLKQCIIRYLVYSFLGLGQSLLFIYCIITTPSSGYSELGFMDKLDFVYLKFEIIFSTISYLEYGYIALTSIFLLFNKQRRSISDYIAGTIVVEN